MKRWISVMGLILSVTILVLVIVANHTYLNYGWATVLRDYIIISYISVAGFLIFGAYTLGGK